MDGSVRSGGSVVVGAAKQVESHGPGDRSARSEGRELSGAAASEGRPEVVSIVMGDVASAGQAATAAVGRLGRTGSQHMTRSVDGLTKDRNQAGGGQAIGERRRADGARAHAKSQRHPIPHRSPTRLRRSDVTLPTPFESFSFT
jgi:hypothetical protein